MAGAVLLTGGVIWSLAGLAGLGAALFGLESLIGILPPLAIDADALRGTLVAIAGACLAVAALHVAAVLALGRSRLRARSAAILLVAVLTAVFIALAAAAFTTAAVDAQRAPLFLAAGAGALLAAAGYGLATLTLVVEQRSESAS